MARSGRAAAALATAAIGSFIAGTLATLALAFAAPYVVDIAIQLGPADYLALMVVAFMTVGALLGSSPARGFASVGARPGHRPDRHRRPERLRPLHLRRPAPAGRHRHRRRHRRAVRHGRGHLPRRQDAPGQPARSCELKGQAWMTREDWKRSWPAWLRGTLIGWPLGAVPVGGSEIPTFLSYAAEKKLSKHTDEFGNGAIEGVAGPEATNNANAAGALMPLLDPRSPDVGHRRRDPRRVPAVRPPARAAAAGDRAGPRLGPGRRAAHRQLHAAGAQPPAGGLWAKVLQHPHPLPVRRNHHVRPAGCLQHQRLGLRRVRAAGDRASSATSCASTASRSRR